MVDQDWEYYYDIGLNIIFGITIVLIINWMHEFPRTVTISE